MEEQVSTGLQIERLKALFSLGIGFLVIFLIAAPLALKPGSMASWASELANLKSTIFAPWLILSTIVLLGAIGGFLSGLLQAESSRVTLIQYQESMLKLRLRPLVGGIVSLILFILLTWQILPGIQIENAGSYLFVAFISGFSERYFLKILDLKTESDDKKPMTTAIDMSRNEDHGAAKTASPENVQTS